MIKNTKVTLASYPETFPEEENFSIEQEALPALSDGEVLCEMQYLSLDPYMRSQIAGRHISGTIGIGDTMQGETVSKVIESKSDLYQKGDLVRCFGGWQSHSKHSDKQVTPVKHPTLASYELSVLGMPGLTAYAGLMWQAQPNKGEVVLVPAATGAVGSVVGQLAKAAGCKVIGIAGSAQKCEIAVNDFGYDACINRKTEDVAAKIDELCPNGIDIYFDLVGGELLHTASERLAVGARVILCGMIAETNSATRMAGPSPAMWIKARATVKGLVVYDFEGRRQEFIDACLPLVEQNNLRINEDISRGIEQAPAAFCRLMRGENIGKAIVSNANLQQKVG